VFAQLSAQMQDYQLESIRWDAREQDLFQLKMIRSICAEHTLTLVLLIPLLSIVMD
jgi:hypothetical protein